MALPHVAASLLAIQATAAGHVGLLPLPLLRCCCSALGTALPARCWASAGSDAGGSRGSQGVTQEISAPCFPSSWISLSGLNSFEKKCADVCMKKWFARASGLILLHDFTGF